MGVARDKSYQVSNLGRHLKATSSRSPSCVCVCLCG